MSDNNYVVGKKTGRKYPIGGCIISDKPSDAPKFGAMRTTATKDLPPIIDLRSVMTPVEEQLKTLACVGNALAGAYEYLIKQHTKKDIDVSRLFIYYNGRRIDGMNDFNMQDKGTQIKSAIQGLVSHGCCKESLFPYKLELINKSPTRDCYEEAQNYKIAQSMSIETNLNEMKACLSEGYPFIFGIKCFESFETAESNGGHVPKPGEDEEEASAHVFHAMLAVGYIDPWKCFIVRNSWGPDWGDKGYCYIPYDYMANPKLCRDIHAIKAVTKKPVHNPSNTDLLSNVNNVFQYVDKFQQNGLIAPSVWQKIVTQDSAENTKLDLNKKLILWIDQRHDGNDFVANKLSSDTSVQIEFRETMQKAQDYLLKNKDSLRSLRNFVIISRGFYKDEKKNPLNLLDFLTKNQIQNAQIFVFTERKDDVEYHFEKQAPAFCISNWKDKLAVYIDPTELMEKIKQSFNKTN